MIRVILNNDTDIEINGVPVTLPRDTHVLFHVDSMSHVAELCNAAKIRIDLSHKDGDEMVTYGAAGKEIRTPIEDEYIDEQPIEDVPDDEKRPDGTPCNTYTEAEAKAHIKKGKKK